MEAYYPIASDQRRTILIVEGDTAFGKFLTKMLRQKTSHHVYYVSQGMQALQLLESCNVDLLILDECLPDMVGIDVYDQIQGKEGQRGIPTLLISSNLLFMKIGGRNIICLDKPVDLNLFFQAVDTLILFPRCPLEA